MMNIDTDSAIKHLESVIAKYDEARKKSAYNDLSGVSGSLQIDVLTSLVAAIQRLAPSDTYYFESLVAAIHDYGKNSGKSIPTILGIAKSLKSAYEGGYLQEIQELIHSDVFADFLEMAEYLLSGGYKDASAVLIGSVLEEHLRNLCLKHDLPIERDGRPIRADTMNNELARNNVYNKLDQKSITAWLDLRNKAAHGQYGEYTQEQVALMHNGIRELVSRLPA